MICLVPADWNLTQLPRVLQNIPSVDNLTQHLWSTQQRRVWMVDPQYIVYTLEVHPKAGKILFRAVRGVIQDKPYHIPICLNRGIFTWWLSRLLRGAWHALWRTTTLRASHGSMAVNGDHGGNWQLLFSCSPLVASPFALSHPLPASGHHVSLCLVFFVCFSSPTCSIRTKGWRLTACRWSWRLCGTGISTSTTQHRTKVKSYFNLSLEAVTLATGRIAPYT